MAESFTAQTVLNNLQINGGKVTSTNASVTQTGSPYMTTSTTGGVNPVVNIATPSCTGQWCSWTELEAVRKCHLPFQPVMGRKLIVLH